MTFSFVSGYWAYFGATSRRLKSHLAVQDWKGVSRLTPWSKYMAQSKGRLNQCMVTVHFPLVYWLFHRTQPVWILCPDMGCHSLEMKPANEALCFGEKDEGNSRFSDPESSYSVWCCFLGCFLQEVMETFLKSCILHGKNHGETSM